MNKELYMNTVFTALGDPLIKGLTEVANVKPKDPVAFLASFLHNFPESEKPRIDTQVKVEICSPFIYFDFDKFVSKILFHRQQSDVGLAQEAPEVENEQVPLMSQAAPRLPRSASRTATRPHRPIDVVTVDPQPVTSPDAPEIAFSSAKRVNQLPTLLFS